MELKPLTQPELDNFVSAQEHSQFLQSWSWGEFQRTIGRRVWRFGVYDDNRLIASASIIEHRLPLKKSYLYCPRGPAVDKKLANEQKEQALKLILSKARDLTIETKQAEEIFFRFEPTFEFRTSNFKFRPTSSIQPPNTLILDLRPTTSDLLKNMHQKTRYNIRLAEKHQVAIRKALADDLNKAWPLFEQTSRRDKFKLHSKNYYQTILNTLNEVGLWVAQNQNNDIIAANLISFFGDTATYLHGASDYKFRQLMAPHLLQWEVIKEAKKRGFKYYDFHGIAPKLKIACPEQGRRENLKLKIKSHPWAGVTRFKKGFGGQAVNYPGTFDFVYEPGWYKIYKIIRKLNRIVR